MIFARSRGEGQITKWTQQADTATPTVHEFQYDNVDQLVADVLKNQSTSAILKRYAYTYDKAGNRTGEQIDDTATQSGYNNLNQLTSLASGGALKFKGSVSEPATVTVQSTPATVGTNNVFAKGVSSIIIILTEALLLAGLLFMSRAPRIEFPGALYHVMSRGNHLERILTPFPGHQRLDQRGRL